jgi:hypothetical protein
MVWMAVIALFSSRGRKARPPAAKAAVRMGM